MSAEPLATGDGDVEPKVARIQELLAGVTDRADEAAILDLLESASAPELELVLARVGAVRLLDDLDDRVIGPDNGARLLKLLCEDRLADLSIRTRAALVSALQAGRTCARDEDAIRRIFLGTRGAALTELKNAVDAGPPGAKQHHDLQQLVFRDIDDDAVRQDILAHIQREAVPRRDLKILSDIDDTLYRNWIDPRYPAARDPVTKKPYLYPGVRAFYRALDAAFEPGDLPDLAFLTARPGDRAGVGEGITRRHLADVGFDRARVLTGDLGHIVTNELIAAKKFAGFVEYKRLFPEYRFVFCGDSGQGDAVAGREMMSHPGGGMLAVFIHDVVSTDADGRAGWLAHGVRFHDTWVGAALDAHALGLLDLASLGAIGAEAIEDMRAVPFEDAAQREARLSELRRDVDRVNALLPAGGRLRV